MTPSIVNVKLAEMCKAAAGAPTFLRTTLNKMKDVGGKLSTKLIRQPRINKQFKLDSRAGSIHGEVLPTTSMAQLVNPGMAPANSMPKKSIKNLYKYYRND